MRTRNLLIVLPFLTPLPIRADSDHVSVPAGAVVSAEDAVIRAPFDILSAHVSLDGRVATFRMTTVSAAGSAVPKPVGDLAGAPVHAYVWPTSIDPATVGFEGGSGILALAATSHPDFDDTPLFDENSDGDLGNDGQA